MICTLYLPSSLHFSFRISLHSLPHSRSHSLSICRYLSVSPPTPYDSQVSLRSAFGNGLRPDSWPTFQERYGVKDIVEFYAATEGNIALVNCFNHVGAIGDIPPVMNRIFPAKIVKVEEEDSKEPGREAEDADADAADPEDGVRLV